MAEQVKDLSRGVLSSSFSTGDVAISLVDAAEFPSTGTFSVRLDNPERTLLTVTGRTGNTFQITPEQNLGGAREGALVVQVLTARSFTKYVEEHAFEGILPIERGGTGASTAEGARHNLGVPGLPVQIFEGGTGATTVQGARDNISVYSKAQIDALVFGTIGVILPLSIESGGTGASTAEQARINLGIGSLEQMIIDTGLVLQNNTSIYWRDDTGTPVGVIRLDTNNNLYLTPPGGQVISEGNILVRNNLSETSVRVRSIANGEPVVGIETEGSGQPRLLFHHYNVFWYSVGLRSDNFLVFANDNSLTAGIIKWYDPASGWHTPLTQWLHSGDKQLIVASGNSVFLGGNADAVYSYPGMVQKSWMLLENGRAIYGARTDGNWATIAYVNSNNVLVVGGSDSADMVINRSYAVQGTVYSTNGFWSAGAITLKIWQPVQDEWGRKWLYSINDGGWNATRFSESSHVLEGANWTIHENYGQQWQDGSLSFRTFGNYGSR